MRGGFWRNFRVKYPEANEMYTRMMMVSRRLQAAIDAGARGTLVEQARTALYRGQCNCAYWHGAFGGIYLPHLRNAIYHQLIAADNLLDRALDRPETWVELTADDYNFDGRQEVQLASDKLVACWPGPRRPAVRARRAADRPQPAGHADPPARGLSRARCWPATTATTWPACTTA